MNLNVVERESTHPIKHVMWWPKSRVWRKRNRAKLIIIKLQVPVAYSGDPEFLAYDVDRSFFAQFPLADESGLKKAMGGRLKAFFYAEVKGTDDDMLRLRGHAPDEGW